MPCVFALFTRAMPAANSGASSPLSAASAASFRIADILIMMDEEPSLRSSRDTRHALTVAFVKPGQAAATCHPCLWVPAAGLRLGHRCPPPGLVEYRGSARSAP